MNDNKFKVIFIIGPPGVGKNTQCEKLVKKYNFIYFGAGDLLREEAKKDTEEGKLILSLIKEGKIVPVKITCTLIKKAMYEKGKNKIFLIDIYLGNKANINGWKEVFNDNYILVTSIIFHCDENILVKRLIERGKISGRVDDNIETIKKRFKTHKEESEPIMNELKNMGPSIEINATGNPQEVLNDIVKELDEIVKKYVK